MPCKYSVQLEQAHSPFFHFVNILLAHTQVNSNKVTTTTLRLAHFFYFIFYFLLLPYRKRNHWHIRAHQWALANTNSATHTCVRQLQRGRKEKCEDFSRNVHLRVNFVNGNYKGKSACAMKTKNKKTGKIRRLHESAKKLLSIRTVAPAVTLAIAAARASSALCRTHECAHTKQRARLAAQRLWIYS